MHRTRQNHCYEPKSGVAKITAAPVQQVPSAWVPWLGFTQLAGIDSGGGGGIGELSLLCRPFSCSQHKPVAGMKACILHHASCIMPLFEAPAGGVPPAPHTLPAHSLSRVAMSTARVNTHNAVFIMPVVCLRAAQQSCYMAARLYGFMAAVGSQA